MMELQMVKTYVDWTIEFFLSIPFSLDFLFCIRTATQRQSEGQGKFFENFEMREHQQWHEMNEIYVGAWRKRKKEKKNLRRA